MTLEEYRTQYGWSVSEMARRANMDYATLKKAIDGESVSARTARALAQFLSKETGTTVHINDIQGLNVNF